MLKRTRAAFFVWGGILVCFGMIFIGIAATTFVDYGFEASSDMTSSALFCALVPGLIMILVAALLFIIGGIKAGKVRKYNRKLIAENEIDEADCPYCHVTNRIRRIDFIPHRKFPEGFIYCKACKKPLSYNTFSVVSKNDISHDEYSDDVM